MKNIARRTACCALGLLLALCAVGCAAQKTHATAAEMLSLGEQYLLELDYEKALVQFLGVIEAEPMNARAYLGAAQAYVGLGQTDNAIGILEQGLAATGDEAIRAMLEGLRETEVELEPEPENLTGKEPFTLQDLEEWGFPYGITIKEFEDRIGLTLEELEQMRLDYIRSDDITEQFPLHIQTVDDKIELISICGFTDLLPSGPRGTRVGMPIDEVLRLFMVHDEHAFDDVTPFELGQRINYLYISDNKFAQIASVIISETDTPTGAYLQYYVADPLNLPNSIHDYYDYVDASLWFTVGQDGIVERIDIWYV